MILTVVLCVLGGLLLGGAIVFYVVTRAFDEGLTYLIREVTRDNRRWPR